MRHFDSKCVQIATATLHGVYMCIKRKLQLDFRVEDNASESNKMYAFQIIYVCMFYTAWCVHRMIERKQVTQLSSE